MHDPVPVAAGGTALGIMALLLCALPVAAQQLQPSARVDLNGFLPATSPAWLISETAPFIGGRASLFLDAFAGNHWYGLAELRVDRGEAPADQGIDARVEQLFVRVTPSMRADVNFQLGRFVTPFGNYPQRHHSSADPFIRPPLNYDYRTILSSTSLPGSNDGFLGWKDEPSRRRAGAPAVWGTPYQLGVMMVGSVRQASFRIAAMNSAPSSEPAQWAPDSDQLGRLSLVAHAAYQFTPELRIGISYNRGSYLADELESAVPARTEIGDYIQQLIGAEATLTRGFVELRAEFMHDTWEVPRVTRDALDISYYLEGKVKLSPGLFAAVRLSEMRFNDLVLSNGAESTWDYDVRRWQLGAGYRISESLELRSELMLNQTSGPTDPRDNLFAVQASWRSAR